MKGAPRDAAPIGPARRLGASLTGSPCSVMSGMVRCGIRRLTGFNGQRVQGGR